MPDHLAIGDYLVDDLFVFERKTLVDLTASIIPGVRPSKCIWGRTS